jgi:hypothetical protein
MSKKKAKKTSFWTKIKQFFFPKDFKGEMKRGMDSGKIIRDKVGGAAWDTGKALRKKVDPEHQKDYSLRKKHKEVKQ